MKKYIFYIILSILSAAIILMPLSGCGNSEAVEENPGEPNLTEISRKTLTEDEVILQATHAVEAVFEGEAENDLGKKELIFTVEDVHKGNLEDKDKGELHVQPLQGEGDEYEFVEDSKYLLFLEKHISVYSDCDVYVLFKDLIVSDTDENWGEYINKAEAASSDSGPSSYGVDYIGSTEIEDIAAFAENIFVIKLKDILNENNDGTTVFVAEVTKTIKNEPLEKEDVYVRLFDEKGELGNEYLVFLGDATETYPVYVLASKVNSIFSIEEAEGSHFLKNLLKTANNF